MLAATEQRLRELRGSRIAMIFQEPMTALNPLLTIGRQIEEAIEVHQPQARDRRKRVLDMLLRFICPIRNRSTAPIRISFPAASVSAR